MKILDVELIKKTEFWVKSLRKYFLDLGISKEKKS